MQANFKVKLSEQRNTLFSVFFPLLGLSVKGKIYALGLKYCPRHSASVRTQDHTGIVFSYTQLRRLQRFCLRK